METKQRKNISLTAMLVMVALFVAIGFNLRWLVIVLCCHGFSFALLLRRMFLK